MGTTGDPMLNCGIKPVKIALVALLMNIFIFLYNMLEILKSIIKQFKILISINIYKSEAKEIMNH